MERTEFTNQVNEMDRSGLESIVLECGLLPESEEAESFDAEWTYPGKTEEELRALVLASFTDEMLADIEDGHRLDDFGIGGV